MPVVERDPFTVAVEVEEERRQEVAAQKAIESAREHELKLAKLKYATQPRYKSIEKCVVALTKILALPVAVIAVAFLAYAGRPVPDSLIKFITI